MMSQPIFSMKNIQNIYLFSFQKEPFEKTKKRSIHERISYNNQIMKQVVKALSQLNNTNNNCQLAICLNFTEVYQFQAVTVLQVQLHNLTMGCTNPKGVNNQSTIWKPKAAYQKCFPSTVQDLQSMKIRTGENQIIKTNKKSHAGSLLEKHSLQTLKKVPEYLSEDQQISFKDIKLSQMQISEIHGEMNNTDSAHQTVQNLFYKTLQTDVNVFDRRRSIKETFIYPYNCIGMLFYCIQTNTEKKSRQYFYFTAFMLSPTLIMTSANAFIPYKQQKIAMPLKFLIRQSQTQTLRSIFTKARLVTKIMKLEKACQKNLHNLSRNYCLLQLQTKVQRQRYLSLACQFKMQKQVQIFGYPMHNLILQCDKGDRENLFGMKGLAKINQLCIEYDIDTSPGQQGAPILISPIEGEYFVIGIHSGYEEKQSEFQQNTNILDILQANSTFMKVELKINIGSHITKKTLAQLKEWSRELKSINQIQFIDFQKFKPSILLTLKQKQTQNEKIVAKTEEKQHQNVGEPIPIVKYLKRAEKYYSRWQPHQSLKNCLKASQNLPPQNKYFQFKINFLLALNYSLLTQIQTALLYFSKCLQFTRKLKNKGIEQIIQEVDLYNNISNIYLQIKEIATAKKFLQKAQQLIVANHLFQHNAFVGTLITRGIIDKQMKNAVKALSSFQKALTIYKRIKGSLKTIERHRVIIILQNITQCYLNLGSLDKWAFTGLQCLKKMEDMYLIERIFQIQWFQSFLSLLNRNKSQLSPQCQFIAAKEINIIIQNCIEKNTEEFKKALLTDLRLLKREKLMNFIVVER